MSALIFTMVSFAALLSIAIFTIKILNIPSAIAPLTAVSFTMLYFSVAGCLNVLVAAGWIYFTTALAMLIYILAKKRNRFFEDISSVGFAIFIICGLLVILLFSYKQPLFTEWDEFSFWGSAAKLVKMNNELFTNAKIGWAWAATQKPGLVVLGYFFNFFGGYAEWRICVGYDILFLSVFSAVVATVEKNKWHIAVPFFFLSFVTPYAFTLYRTILKPYSLYMSALSDIPMAAMFGGVICLYYALSIKNKPLWPVAAAIGALTMTRDTALPLALVAAGIIAVDILLCGKEAKFLSVKGIYAKLCNISVIFITPILCFVGWAKYISTVLNVDVTGNIGGTEKIGMFGMVLSGVKQLIGIDTTEKFSVIMGKMFSSFFEVNLTVIGSGFRVVMLILIVVLIAILASPERTHRIRCVIFAVFSTLGFAAYYLFIGFCYVFIFKDIESSSLMSYERYIYSYYIGWFLAALFLLCYTAVRKAKLFTGVPEISALAITALFVARLSNIITPGMSFIDYDKGFLYERQVQVDKSNQIREIISKEEDTKIFFIGQGDDGGRWFSYSSELLPLQLEYSFGGGTLCLPQDVAEGTYYFIRLTPKEFCDYLIKNNCGYVFVEKSDDYLLNGFKHLFNDGLSACSNGDSAVYKVENKNGSLSLNLVAEVK